MNNRELAAAQAHSAAWIIQAWVSFTVSICGTAIGITYLPVDGWIKGYLGMGLTFAVGSTISISKTTRDIHEAQKLTARVDEARVEKLLSDHHPLK
jgi:hypothetical protein